MSTPADGPERPLRPDPTHAYLRHGSVLMMTMRAEDAPRWKPAELVALAQSFSAGALGFSVGGVTAFYPTAIPGQPCSVKDGCDLVGDTISALHAAGIRAIGRVDPSLGSAEEFERHPERFARAADGQPMRLHDYYLACPSGEHFGTYMLQVIREILERYPLDGLWANAAQFSPWSSARCYCENCRRRFAERGGADLPKEDWADPVWKDYNEWRYQRIVAWNAEVKALTDAVRPSCAWLPLSQIGESWDHIRKGGWDVDQTAPLSHGIVLEAQRRYCNLWWPGMEARYAHALDPEKPSAVTASYFYPWWRFTHAPIAENQVWVGQIVANGARPWLHLTGYMSDLFDRRGLEPMRQLFRLLREEAAVYEDRRSVAEVALVFSRASLDYAGGADPDANYLDGVRGAYNALVEAKIPFDLVSDRRISAERIARYRCVVLPNFSCMSDEAEDGLEAYLRGGGHAVATFQTGFRDQLGEPRAEPVVARLLGAVYKGQTRRDLKAAYAFIGRSDHALLRGIGDTDLLPLAYGACEFEPGRAADADVLRLVPPVEARPGSGMSVPEFNSAGAPTDLPLLLTAPVGSGRLTYLPWEPDRLGFSFGLRDPLDLIANAVRATRDWTDLVTVGTPATVDCSVMDAPGSRVLHLVNFTSSGGLRSSHRRAVEYVVPVRDVEITLRVPAEWTATHVRLVRAGRTVQASLENGRIRFVLPELAEFESIVVQDAAVDRRGSAC